MFFNIITRTPSFISWVTSFLLWLWIALFLPFIMVSEIKGFVMQMSIVQFEVWDVTGLFGANSLSGAMICLCTAYARQGVKRDGNSPVHVFVFDFTMNLNMTHVDGFFCASEFLQSAWFYYVILFRSKVCNISQKVSNVWQQRSAARR